MSQHTKNKCNNKQFQLASSNRFGKLLYGSLCNVSDVQCGVIRDADITITEPNSVLTFSNLNFNIRLVHVLRTGDDNTKYDLFQLYLNGSGTVTNSTANDFAESAIFPLTATFDCDLGTLPTPVNILNGANYDDGSSLGGGLLSVTQTTTTVLNLFVSIFFFNSPLLAGESKNFNVGSTGQLYFTVQ